jgi:hypothetical protein
LFIFRVCFRFTEDLMGDALIGLENLASHKIVVFGGVYEPNDLRVFLIDMCLIIIFISYFPPWFDQFTNVNSSSVGEFL